MVLLLKVSSHSSLLYASLAHITPEVITVDDVIEWPGRRPRLPTELMLIVRDQLVHELAADLSKQSNHALALHAQSLISLLCADCASYNTEIYGKNVFDWPWDQFSGPCLCRGDIGECLVRTQPFTDNLARLQCDLDDRSALYKFKPISSSWAKCGQVVSKGELLQFSPQLLDPHFFLELFLSRQARRFARLALKQELKEARRGSGQGKGRMLALLKVRTIWDVVQLVLLERYQAELIRGASNPTHAMPVPTPNTFRATGKAPSKRAKIETKSQPENEICAEIVDLDVEDLEALRTCPSTPSSVTSFFLSSLMSPTYRSQRDPIYISLVRNRPTSVKVQVEDPWVAHTLLLGAKHSLGLSNSVPFPLPPSCTSSPEPTPQNLSNDTDRLLSCNDGARPPTNSDTGSDNANHVADSNSQSPIHYLSVPSWSPATKPLPVLVAPTTGITPATGTTQTGDVVVVVDPLAPSQNDIETGAAGVKVETPDAKRRARHIGRAVVVGAPDAEAMLLAEPERQINHGPLTWDADGSMATTSSVLSQDVGDVGGAKISLWMRVPGTRLDVCRTPRDCKASSLLLPALAPLPSFIAACLCAPFAIVGLAVTVLCFYSRPRSFRVL